MLMLALWRLANLYMGDFVPPTKTKNPLQTADVEGLDGFDVMPV